jgi:hypothetical protein
MASACSGKNPAAPTPPPIPAASLVLTGQGSFTNCTILGDCLFSASIQNVGPGCAANTTVVVRFYDAATGGAQVGADVQMGATGGLSGRTIRPQEIVPLTALSVISPAINTKTKAYQLFPTWTDVRC